ncbi:MAG TPA: hypothetical protein ENN39_03265, partial [Desulfonatronum sp.]|nr:hypothetical protein [Desulfonatronum sp.]
MIRRRTPQRGDVYWIDPNPTSGREMRDRHRFVVITPGEINVLGLVMTVPVTSGGMFARQTGLTVPIIGHDTQGVAVCNQVGIIVGAMSFTKNVYDGHTLPQVLEQAWQITETCPKVAICDR